ncbi:MAG: DR2241 family protein, partial [Verrucomicrobiota bacterium]
EEGNYRPLKTAPTLARGWMSRAERVDEFLSHLDAIYPGVFATWIAYDAGIHAPTPLRQTLDRQTGIYRFAGAITDQMANRIMRETCARGCIRQIAWPIDDTCAVSKLKGSRRFIPSICTEACTFAVSETRRLAKEAYDKANAPAGAEELRS